MLGGQVDKAGIRADTEGFFFHVEIGFVHNITNKSIVIVEISIVDRGE